MKKKKIDKYKIRQMFKHDHACGQKRKLKNIYNEKN